MKSKDSDLLPFVQVHRSALSRAPLLANALGCSTQHALGALVQFWALISDPRELEASLAATPEGEEPAIILDLADLQLRWKLSAGLDVQPEVLERLGFIERLDGEPTRYRIRGLGRYLDAVRRRRALRAAGRKGGRPSKASTLSEAKRVGAENGPDPFEDGKGRDEQTDGPQPNDEKPPFPNPTSEGVEKKGLESLVAENGPDPFRSRKGQETKRREERGDIDRSRSSLRRSRSPSAWESAWKQMQAERLERLEEVGVERPTEGWPTQEFAASRLNQLLRGAAEVLERLDPIPRLPLEDRSVDLLALWRRYLHDTYWQSRTPPWPLEGFVAPKTLERLHALWGTRADPLKQEPQP